MVEANLFNYADYQPIATGTASQADQTAKRLYDDARSQGSGSALANGLSALTSPWAEGTLRSRVELKRDFIDDDPDRVAAIVEKLKPLLDRDSDGYISTKELDQAIKKNSWTEAEAAMIASFKQNYSAITKFSNDEWGWESEISMKDLDKMIVLWRASERNANKDIKSIGLDLWAGNAELINANFKLYASKNPLDSIRPEAICQPLTIGNCHLVAAIQSMAAVNPQKIVDMIKDEKNGQYTVTFPGLDPITVDQPTKAELAYYRISSPDGIWPAILMKAYGKYWKPSAEFDIEGGEGGSIRNDGTRKITGTGIDSDSNWCTRYTTMVSKLNNAFASGKPVTASIAGEIGCIIISPDNREDETGLDCGHAYGVIGFSENKGDPKKSVITIINPHLSNSWFGGKPPADIEDLGLGKMRMSLEKFNKVFTSLSYSE